jgi:hypothetical protein
VWWVRGLVVVLKTFMRRCEYVTRPVRKVKGEGTIGGGCGPGAGVEITLGRGLALSANGRKAGSLMAIQQLNINKLVVPGSQSDCLGIF